MFTAVIVYAPTELRSWSNNWKLAGVFGSCETHSIRSHDGSVELLFQLNSLRGVWNSIIIIIIVAILIVSF